MLYSKASLAKAKAWQDAGLGCAIPYLRRPFDPIFQYIRCKTGFDEGFMEAPTKCTVCNDPNEEDREITMDNGLPDLEEEMPEINTLSDCFTSMRKVTYGVRAVIKIIDDEDCSDPKNIKMCDDLEKEGRTISEDECTMPRYDQNR